MTSLWFGLLLCSGLLWSATANLPKPKSNGTYLLMVSKTIRANAVMKMSVQLTSVTHPVYLRVELMDFEGIRVQQGASYYLSPRGGLRLIKFKFSKYLMRPKYYIYFLRVIASGGVSFEKFLPLQWKNRQINVLIQTDKISYTPGQKVRLRAFGMLVDNKVPDEPMDLYVRDPLNNLVAYFNRKRGDKSRVLSAEFQLPEEPRIGIYTIRARMYGGTNKKHFAVFNYDAPNFEVKIWVPRVDVSDKKVKIKIVARSLIGTSIQGSGILRIQASYIHLHGSKPYIVEKKFQIDRWGYGIVHVNMSEIKQVLCTSHYYYRYHCSHSHSMYYVSYRSVRLIATVKDHNSYQVVKTTKDVYMTALKSYLKIINTEYRFKRGLPHHVTVQDTQSSGKPVRKLRYGNTINVTVTYKARQPNKTYCYWTYYRSPYQTLFNQTVTIDEETKQATFKIPQIPDDACFVRIYGKDGKRYFYRYMYPYYSKSGTYFYIEYNKPLSTGKTRRITAMSNRPFKTIYCLVYARGELVFQEEMTKPRAVMSTSFQFNVIKEMTPVAHVFMFTITSSGELVGDLLTVDVEYYPYSVSLRLNGQKNKPIHPGKTVSVTVQSTKGAEVLMLGRDVRVLTKYNDVNMDDVTRAKMTHDTSFRYYPYEYNVADMIRNAGLGAITNINVGYSYYYGYYHLPRHYQLWRYWYYYYYRSYYYRCHRYIPLPGPPGRNIFFRNRPLPLPSIHMPDTWIWASQKAGKKNSVMTYTVPDTISNFSLKAFAIHPKKGLSLSKEPAQLVVTKKLFATMFLTDTAVRGETVCFSAIAHNSDSANHSVAMNLERSENFDVVQVKKVDGKYKESFEYIYAKRDLGVIGPGHMQAARFCVRFNKIGDIRVRIAIESDAVWDDMINTIKIKSEGTSRTKSFPVLLELKSSTEVNTSILMNLPNEVVANSFRVSVDVSTDPLGTAIQNLGQLLKIPHGNGAHNLINMGPNIHILNYLKATKRLDKYQAMARNNMHTGYLQQMIFQRYNGGFSSHGNWDKQSSTWLSAFVLTVFSQVSQFRAPYALHLEPDMVLRLIGYVTEQQKADGGFVEKGRPLYARLQGKSAEAEMRLTAFVTMALWESRMSTVVYRAYVAKYRALYAIAKARAYMVKRLHRLKIDDPYSRCITAYTLSQIGSNNISDAVTLMTSASTTVGDVYRYWAGGSLEEQIEKAAYGLMTYLKNGMKSEAIMVYRWLIKHRGPRGGFLSTQDTVLALQAMAAMTSLAPKETFNDVSVKVKVTRALQSQFYRMFSVKIKSSDQNVIMPRKSNLNWPSEHKPGTFIVQASSNVPSGQTMYAMAQVTVKYNVKRVPPSGGLKAAVSIKNNTVYSFTMHTCLYRLATVDLHPVYVAEFIVPTGYTLDKKESMYGTARKVRYANNKVIMYIPANKLPCCTSLRMHMDKGRVVNVNPPMVRFYNPFNRNEEVVEGCLLKQFNICEVEPKICS